jgi:hypothetical protein
MLNFCMLLMFAAAEPTPAFQENGELARVHRVYVELLSGDSSSLKTRDLLMASLQASKLIVITEDQEKADAVLKGSGEDKVFNETHSSSEGVNAHTQLSTPSTNSSSSRYSNRMTAGLSVGENESQRSEERKHEAIATVRLVDKNGDVIWSTTQESLGGKFMGAAADVADKVARKLSADLRRCRHLP